MDLLQVSILYCTEQWSYSDCLGFQRWSLVLTPWTIHKKTLSQPKKAPVFPISNVCVSLLLAGIWTPPQVWLPGIWILNFEFWNLQTSFPQIFPQILSCTCLVCTTAAVGLGRQAKHLSHRGNFEECCCTIQGFRLSSVITGGVEVGIASASLTSRPVDAFPRVFCFVFVIDYCRLEGKP